jgi:hypothetical protein
MAIQVSSNGSFVIEYEGNFLGIDTMEPETLCPDKASPGLDNIMLRNSELRSRPNFVIAIPGPNDVSNNILGLGSFQDINGTFHTLVWGAGVTVWQYAPLAGPPPWTGMLGAPSSMGPNPISHRVFANSMYYTNVNVFKGISRPFLAYWDGLTGNPIYTQTYADTSTSQSIAGISLTDSPTIGGSLPGAPVVTGPLAIGGQYLGELNNQLLLWNVSVLDQASGKVYVFPNTLWWSANGLPKQWDPTQNTSAGFNSFLDVSDQGTGLMTNGIAGYLFRTFGITQMTPTGSAVTPWEFDHMWASDRGIGSVFPWSIAQYGPTGAFISEDNIYTISVTNAQTIGGKARDAIFVDLLAAISIPVANIIPIIAKGYIYLTYQIVIHLSTLTRIWMYSMEEKNWTPWDVPISAGVCNCPPNSV